MIRILMIDDADVSSIIDEVRRDAGYTDSFEPIAVNPLDYVRSEPNATVAAFLEEVKARVESCVDVVAIDRNLGDLGLSGDMEHHLALSVSEAIREKNLSTAVILYSGTLSDYLATSFSRGDRDGLLRRIFKANISNFTPRSRVAREISVSIANPSWLLRVDRMLMKHATITVAPEESEFRGRAFADLAKAVRCQNRDGQRIAELVAEYGVSCFADLNS